VLKQALKPPRGDRLIGLLLFVPTSIVLGLSLWLQPDTSGVGTHQQLGLSECVFLVWTGLPCPMCGMTTTFSHMAHLEWGAATLNQPFGVVLFALTVFVAVLGAQELLFPKGKWRVVLGWAADRDRWLALGLLGGMSLGWIYKATLMSGFLPWSP
jgi:hypothetical protein